MHRRQLRLGSTRELQLLARGMAVAVLIDGTLIWLVLVPVTMEMLGRATWWLPRRLDRALPHSTVEAPVVRSPGR